MRPLKSKESPAPQAGQPLTKIFRDSVERVNTGAALIERERNQHANDKPRNGWGIRGDTIVEGRIVLGEESHSLRGKLKSCQTGEVAGCSEDFRTREQDLFKQPPAEKAKLLKMELSNCAIDAVSLYPTYRKPFDLIFQRTITEGWLPGLDSN